MHPDAIGSKFRLQPQRIVDADFAPQKDHRQRIAEGPGLDRVVEFCLQRFAAIELRQLKLRVVAGRVVVGGKFFKFSASRQRVERQIDVRQLGRHRPADRLEAVPPAVARLRR